MKNIKVVVLDKDYIVVKADTERFGDDEIMYEGNTFKECFEYITRETGWKSLKTRGTLASLIKDRTGDIRPSYIEVWH